MANLKVASESSAPRDPPPPAKPAQAAQKPVFAIRMPSKPPIGLPTAGGRCATANQPRSKSDKDDEVLGDAWQTANILQQLMVVSGMLDDGGQSGDESEDDSDSDADADTSAGAAGTASWLGIDPLENDGLDMDGLSGQLEPMTAEEGIFELLLPGDEKMGVVVQQGPADVHVMLSPSSETLGRKMKRAQMELQGRLTQRIGRDVNLTVL